MGRRMRPRTRFCRRLDLKRWKRILYDSLTKIGNLNFVSFKIFLFVGIVN